MAVVAVKVVNPLPDALGHYERALAAVLAASGCAVAHLTPPSIEMTVHSRRLRAAAATLRWRRALHDDSDLVVLWPAFGLADVAMWPIRTGSTSIVVHDPEPLRRQWGMGRIASRLGSGASRHRVTVVVHSETARDVLRRAGWTTTFLPHPIEEPRSVDGGGRLVTVLGQWKPARSLQPLKVLAGDPQLDGRRVVVGRSWPAVDGWDVDDRFVDEAEFEARIDAAACVVVPYERYFQSGVAIRALERLTPVVGRRHPFIASVFGEDWPGFVADEDWPGAVARATSVSRDRLASLRQEYWEHCVHAWRQFVGAS